MSDPARPWSRHHPSRGSPAQQQHQGSQQETPRATQPQSSSGGLAPLMPAHPLNLLQDHPPQFSYLAVASQPPNPQHHGLPSPSPWQPQSAIRYSVGQGMTDQQGPPYDSHHILMDSFAHHASSAASWQPPWSANPYDHGTYAQSPYWLSEAEQQHRAAALDSALPPPRIRAMSALRGNSSNADSAPGNLDFDPTARAAYFHHRRPPQPWGLSTESLGGHRTATLTSSAPEPNESAERRENDAAASRHQTDTRPPPGPARTQPANPTSATAALGDTARTAHASGVSGWSWSRNPFAVPGSAMTQSEMDEIDRLRRRARGRRAVTQLEQVDISKLDESERTCNICYNDFGTESPEGVTEQALKIPNCGHVFGHDCIATWLNDQDICPYCRAPLDTTEPDANPEMSTRSLMRYVRSVQVTARAERWQRPRADVRDSARDSASGEQPGLDTTSELNQQRRHRTRPRWSATPIRHADRHARFSQQAPSSRSPRQNMTASPSRSRPANSNQGGSRAPGTTLPSMDSHLRNSLYRENTLHPGSLPSISTMSNPSLSPTFSFSELPTAVI